MIDIEEAYEILFANVEPGPIVELDLRDAVFRTLAAPVRCDTDYPPFDRAVMDGYAVRSSDVADSPVSLAIVGQVPAGVTVERMLGASEAMQINTGAAMPMGADAVVRVEETEVDEAAGTVLIKTAVAAATFVTPKAAYVAAGDVVLEAGTLLTPLAISAAAAAGAARVQMYRRPKVSVLSTGDELVDIHQKPTGAQIRNSNAYLLSALVQESHAEVETLGVACDNRETLKKMIVEALHSDVVCITGGISMGAFDFVPEVLKECGATFHIHKLSIKPGRPTIFATMADSTLVFALPGNPASAFIGYELLVKPALAAREGRGGRVPQAEAATLAGELVGTRDRRTYVPARAQLGENGLRTVTPLAWQGSGDAFGMATANALVVRPPHAEPATDGAEVFILPLCGGS